MIEEAFGADESLGAVAAGGGQDRLFQRVLRGVRRGGRWVRSAPAVLPAAGRSPASDGGLGERGDP